MDEWVDILLDFLGAESLSDIRRVLNAHLDELLRDEVDAKLIELIARGRDRGDEFVRKLDDRRWLLARCQDVGVDRAVTEWSTRSAGDAADDRAARLRALFERLADLEEPRHIPERIELLVTAMELVSYSENASAWAMLCYALGDSLMQDRRGDPAENVERAILAFRAILKVLPSQASPAQWAMTHRKLGAAYLERRKVT